MSKRYFKVHDDMSVPGRWELDAPRDVQGREIGDDELVRGEAIAITGVLHIPLCRPGRPLDFSFMVTGPIPVVSERAAYVFREFAGGDVQMLPATVEGRSELYHVVNVRKVVRCIDDELSEEVEVWQPEDGRQDKVGQYRGVLGMRIDPHRVGDAKVFRPWGWKVALVVAEEIKDALERIGATGTDFTEV